MFSNMVVNLHFEIFFNNLSYILSYLSIPFALVFIYYFNIIKYNILIWIISIVSYLLLPYIIDLLIIDPKTIPYDFNNKQQNEIPIIYHDKYNITAYGIEKFHPFDSQKYKGIYERLTQQDGISSDAFMKPKRATKSDLLMIHTHIYLALLHSSFIISSIVELPFVWLLPSFILRRRLLEPMLYQTGGTLLAGEAAMYYGWAINLGGGFHHAYSRFGGGFCVYADISILISHLRTHFSSRARKVLIIDTDAHQDVFNPYVFPGDMKAKKAIDITIHVTSNTSDELYLKNLYDNINTTNLSFSPDYIIYNAGTDCLYGDNLGRCQLSKECIMKRDLFIFNFAMKTLQVPIIMLLSGGYGGLSLFSHLSLYSHIFILTSLSPYSHISLFILILSGGYQKNNSEIIYNSISSIINKLELI